MKKSYKLVCVVVICAFFLGCFEVKNAEVTVNPYDVSEEFGGKLKPFTRIEFADGRELEWRDYSSRTITEPCSVVYGTAGARARVPIHPKRSIKFSVKKLFALRPEPMLAVVCLGQEQRRKVMLYYPPAGSVWHVPGGVSMLTSFMRQHGHEVKQRWGHIIGLEYILQQFGGREADEMLAVVRSSNASVHQMAEARATLERISQQVETSDKFKFERNNVVFQSQFQDGTVLGALRVIANRQNHLFYKYFAEIEVPKALEFSADAYGISVGDERQLFPGLVLASMIKDAIPDCKVVLGGNLFGRMPDPKDYPDFVQLFGHLDAIVYAEGFQPLLQIVKSLDPSSATGTIWSDGSRVIKNPRTTSPTEFETLPPPALDGGAQQWSPEVVPTLYTQSHCTQACDFCAIPAQSDDFAAGRLNSAVRVKPRSVSPRQLALNMQTLGASKFDIVDELFHVKPQLELGRELKEIGYEATWQCYLTITDNLLNPQVARDLYAAGCRAVQFGLETLSKDSVLKVHKQWNNPSSYERILQNFREAGIHTHVFLMVGLPSEPLYEGLRWVGFLKEHGRNILTIKSGRWRPARYAPEVEKGLLSAVVDLHPDTKPFHTNRSFHYLAATHSNTKVDAMRDILEQACRRHWAYAVTSTIPWWVNRSRYTWEELEEMAGKLPQDPGIPHLKDRIAQMRFLVRSELNRDANFQTWEELENFAVTLL